MNEISDKPLISVIIPNYNRDASAAVQSVLNQTYRNFEVIVVDDGSAKPAAESLAEAGISDPRLRVLRQPNGGQAMARNNGAEKARGDILVFLDDDDLFHPEKLARQIAYMEKHELDVSLTDFTLPKDQHVYSMRNSWQNAEWLLLTRFLCLPSTMMIKKDFFLERGGFATNPELRRVEDYDFALKLYRHFKTQPKKTARHNFKRIIMPELLSHYSGFHATNFDAERKALEALDEKYRGSFCSCDPNASEKFHVAIDFKIATIALDHKSPWEHIKAVAPLVPFHPGYTLSLSASALRGYFHWPMDWIKRSDTQLDTALKAYTPR